MDFCISRIEHFKAADCSGVYREASRNLSRYPHSEVVPELTKNNVCLCSIFDPQIPIVKQIEDLKQQRNIKGRFNVKGSNPRNLTNIMSQAFFKLTSGFTDGLSKEEIVRAYSDCLEWFRKEYPSVIILSAYIHFDEPNAGPHMHINFCPVHDDGEKQIFSSSKVFKGSDHYTQYQDKLHAWATNHFSFDFSRRKPGSDKAKHLSVPEYKQAMRDLEEIEQRIYKYEPAIMAIHEIESIGTPALFGGYKVPEQDLEDLKATAIANVQNSFVLRRMEQERDDYRERLTREREISNRLAKENRIMRDYLTRLKAFFSRQNLSHIWDKVISTPLQRGRQKSVEKER